MSKKHIFFYLFLVFIFACNSMGENVVAKYKDYELTTTELIGVIPPEISKEDSARIADGYIKNWLKEKVLMENSQDILSNDKLLMIEAKVQDYKNELILNELEEEWLEENPPEEPTDEEVKAFYDKNPNIIPVNNTIVEYQFINSDKEDLYKSRELLKKNTPEALEELSKLAKEKKYTNQLKKNQWVEWDDLVSITPLSDNSPQSLYLVKNKMFEIKNKDKIFLLKVVDYAKKGEAAPLSYSKKALKSILLNKRKLNLLSQKKEDLYQKAIYENEIQRK
ncbi:hypothetical protein KRX57_05585 [Weeksellaceae bacterium TAE3-ERU29]|nr:hypothetical protein [Weeksellaceae bacterium TAE3-ERU29]